MNRLRSLAIASLLGVAGVVALLVTPSIADASPFTCPFAHAGCDGASFDPGYDPNFALYFTGSLYTIDANNDGLGQEGVVVFGDRNMTDLGGNPVNPATSLRAFNIRAQGGDPFPGWNPDTPDADPDWVDTYGGSERYGFDFALGAGKALSTLDPSLDWAVTLYPWAPGHPSSVVQPFSGTVESFTTSFVGDGTGGVVDQMISKTYLRETDGLWNIDFDADGTDDEVIQLLYSKFLYESVLYEVANSFEIPNPLGAGEWTLNEWSTINPDNGVQGLNPLQPVPIPPALPLFATGIAMVGALGWRSRRSAAGG